jgi:hypothetical protein
MKLIPRRKSSPTTFERITGFVKLGTKGLVAQRVARRALRTYKLIRRIVPLAILGGIGAAVAKKVRGGGGGGTSTPSYSPPPSSSTGSSAPTSAAAAATAATGTPPATNGAAASGPEIGDALEDAGVAGDGPDTPKEAAAPGVGDESSAPPAGESGGKWLPPSDASGTDETLDVEAPNQSTPPPPKEADSKS